MVHLAYSMHTMLLPWVCMETLHIILRIISYVMIELCVSVARMIRHCVEDIELERHTLPKGADVYIPTFLVQKSPDHWPHPNKFNPSR